MVLGSVLDALRSTGISVIECLLQEVEKIKRGRTTISKNKQQPVMMVGFVDVGLSVFWTIMFLSEYKDDYRGILFLS